MSRNQYFTIFYPGQKDKLPEDLLSNYDYFLTSFKRLHRTGNIQKMTKEALNMQKDNEIYPWYVFAHEGGLMHVFFEDGVSHYDTSFMDKIVDLLIDKGEFVKRCTPDLIEAYEHKTYELSQIQRRMKDYVIEHYKKNKGR